MSQSRFEYGKWVEEALREVVRRALEQASAGLDGGHHFYLTFRTDAPGVEIPDYLHAQYPREMTIALQHQFWGLKIFAEHFEVTLSFNRINETLRIPFASLTAFADPSVNFGLQLNITELPATTDVPAAEPAEGATPALPAAVAKSIAPPLDKPEPKGPRPARNRSAEKTAKKNQEAHAAPAEGDKKGEVIAFEAFKKK